MSTQETFISHLIELRERLIRALAAIILAAVLLVIWPGFAEVFNFVAEPLGASKLVATDILGGFTVPLKVLFLAALMLSLPYVLYQAWAFVAPGLYEHEKKFALPMIVASTFLFYLGVAFCYYFVLGKVFEFVKTIAPATITPMPEADKYLSFALTMFLAFGIAFEIPIAVVLLVRTGIVDVQKLVEVRPYVILGNAVVAAVVTPPDAVSMLALLVPMCLLYEVGIFFARFVTARPKSAPQDSTDPA